MSQTQIEMNINGRKITLIGTAHISEQSVEEVSEAIKNIKPDCVAIELDEKRCDSIKNPEKYREIDIIKILKNGDGFL
ncbi:MAG: TraB domain-containing protein, partial [Treponemataceae bacterium]|nr:TraB domain-containing protein [Treponemataceae bacterium]